MSSIYKNEAGHRAVLDLYDRQMREFGLPFEDRYVETSFGKTHVVETGDPKGKPLLLFHGGNATTAYNLKFCGFLFPGFHIYAVDTIGHPGKSAETCLSPRNNEYGEWASQVITELGYSRMTCFGGSFGGGVLVKLMCTAPEKVERSGLLVPAALRNAPLYKSMSMMLPMILYWITHSESWFEKCILPMAVTRENITQDILDTARCSIDHAKIKAGMPADAQTGELKRYRGPVLVMAAEQDCLFPGEGVLARAREVWPQCGTYLLKGRGHIHQMTREEEQQMRGFLLADT